MESQKDPKKVQGLGEEESCLIWEGEHAGRPKIPLTDPTANTHTHTHTHTHTPTHTPHTCHVNHRLTYWVGGHDWNGSIMRIATVPCGYLQHSTTTNKHHKLTCTDCKTVPMGTLGVPLTSTQLPRRVQGCWWGLHYEAGTFAQGWGGGSSLARAPSPPFLAPCIL